MAVTEKLTTRNQKIAELFTDEEKLKAFYRFVSQNPHINLRDACQILILRPDATVCFSYDEWGAVGRQVKRGARGIAYYDYDGYRQFVYDATDTRGENRAYRPIIPVEKLLSGLDEINGTDFADSEGGDYQKIHDAVHFYLHEQDALTGDEERDQLTVEGVAFSLYAQTESPQFDEITLQGLPYSYSDNAAFVKEIYVQTAALVQEVEDAYRNKQARVEIIDDTEEETVSDEPIVAIEESARKIVEIHSVIRSNYKGYNVLLRWTDTSIPDSTAEIYLGKEENYDNAGHYDNTDNSLVFISNNQHFFHFLSPSHWVLTQQEFIDEGEFTERDYKEFYDLQNGLLKGFEQIDEVKFGVNVNDKNSGVPFRYPNWRDEKAPASIVSKPVEPQSFTVSSFYQRYLDAQKINPQAIVIIRCGDFYEIMGESAKIVAQELDLTLTGRNVGLPERVPMCGMPFHAMDKYLDKILENHGVILVEDEEEPKYILSHAEARAEQQDKKQKPIPVGVPDDAPNPFDEDKNDEDDWRDELADELSDMDESEVDEDEIESDDSSTGKPKEKNNLTPKKPEKGIKDRKRKEKPPLSLWDIAAPQEQSQEEQLIERQLKYGSGVQHGKFRIFDKYQENPTLKTFADFLKNEYGWGGHGGWNGDDEMHDAKGITMSVRGEKGEELVKVYLKWSEVAVRIADLIDGDNYFTDKEKEQYVEYRAEQHRLRELRKEQEQQKRELINHVIYSADPERKQRILDEYAGTTQLAVFAEFLKNEYGTYNEHGDGYSAIYNAQGIWISRGENVHDDYPNRIYLNWNEFADKVCTLIENDRYIELRELQDTDEAVKEKIKAIADRIVKEGTENTSGGNWVVYFDEFEDDEQFVQDHKGQIEEVLSSREEVAQIDVNDEGFDTTFYHDYCPNCEDVWHEFEDKDEDTNTDLNGVLDQSELGGAKTRFKNNVAAIRLVNQLYAENRNATDAERKVLVQFVGWGGLSQAFDENNPQWKKEYAELKTLLSQEDYEQARSSTLNAYYTAKDVIGGIYQALARFGVRGNNRILEPSMGTGNFFGFMPQEIVAGARLYGVELDNLTGRIAAKLYPQANVQIKGFEDTSFPNDKFDIVVGNVPFGGYGIADSDYNRYNFKVHDYFLAKSIDKVKPNGIVAIVTSKGTMDKLNPSARKYVAERAELLGAIRLPNTAFKQTAGTEAVADILFFRKRTERINTAEEKIEWLATGKTEEGYEINQYFVTHPEMILGTLAEETGLYGGVDVTVKSDGRNLSDALAEAVKNLPQGLYLNPEFPPEAEQVSEVDYSVKPMCYKAESGRLYMRVGEEMVEQRIPSFPKDAYQRIQGMIALREELHHILDIQIQGCSDETLQAEQRKLNALYDRFVRQYGNLNGQTNTRLFKDDGDSALLFACEDVNEETQVITKSDIFYKRTIRPYTVPTNTDDCFEALQISKNERGWVDISYIEELTGKSYDTVITELGNAVFRDPDLIDEEDKYSGFVTSEEYLSGKVVAKLGAAQRYAEEHPEYRKNVDALIAVQPEPITASEISVRLGQTWVGKEVYKKFYLELIDAYWYMKSDVELYYNPHDSSWRIDQKDSVRRDTRMKQTEIYGTKRAPAYRLFIDCLNGRDTSIFDTIEENGKPKSVLNQAETIAAREKQNKIREEFQNWVFADPERREALERKYNAIFNQTRLPSYDGSYLRFPEMSPAIELNPHQKNAVHRIITSDGSTLLHHVVGSGKTFTIIASIMKMRQLGLCKKAMVTVPNHLVEQWAGEWRKLYPNANILVATKEDLEKDNRQKFVSKVALGDWDGIIIAQSAFAKIPISKERQVRKLNEEIESVRLTIESRKSERMSGGSVKNLERIIKNKQKQLKTLMSDEKKDGVLIFENLGVDYLYVDEAHYYKNLFLFTKMNNVAGISNAASQRASDLKLKCEYLQELHGSDKGVVFATGTPISNSMTEMYTMQTYLQPTELRDHGIMFFDGWAADFGETVTSMELSPSGQGYRTRTRFSKFTNLPELQKMYRSFADVITSDMVKLDVPEAERKVITLKPSDTVIDLAQEIAERADRIYGGGVDPHEDNMLKVTSDGKKLALDPRCFVLDAADEQGSKLNEAAQRIFEIWESTVEGKGTQIVFCDLSTPKKRNEEYIQGEDFDAYNELKYKLVQSGIPAEEIAYIHDAATDEQKQALFDKVNSGTVRVLIGSTEKCGAGTNVQKRLIALHHLDTPYRPSDMEQREGRIIRQGNSNKQVQIYTYVMERTFDSYSYQILENKQRFISQICKGDFTAREYEDVDTTTMSYAEIKAITAANPRIKRKMEVDTEIIRLRVLEGQYKKNLFALQDKIRKDFPEEIHKQELLIERVTEDLQTAKANRPAPDTFRINVNGVEYTEKKEGGLALMDAINSRKLYETIAEYRGFKISIDARSVILGEERDIILTATGQYGVSVGDSANGTLTRLDNLIEDLPARKERLEKRLAQMKSDLAIAEEQVTKPFEHAETLSELLKEQAELNAELNLDKRETVIMDDGNGGDEENYMGVPIDKKSIMEVDIIDDREIKEEQREEGKIDYETAVKESVVAEYDEFKAEMTKRSPDEVFQESYRIGAYNSFSSVIEDMEVYFTEEDYKALHKDRGHILGSLYDEFLKTDGYPVDDYDETVAFIKSYCRRFHSELYYKDMPIYLHTSAYAYIKDIAVMPDYTINQSETSNAGNKGDDSMLLIRKPTAKILVKLGLPVRTINGDNSEREVSTVKEEEKENNLFGIKNSDWKEFISSDRGRAYLYTRLQFCQATKKVLSHDMNHFPALYVDALADNNFEERSALEKYLSDMERPKIEQMKPHVIDLLENFMARFSSFPLKELGWDMYNVRDCLVENIDNNELNEYVNDYVYNDNLHAFIDYYLERITWLNGKTEGFDKKYIPDIVSVVRPHFEQSVYNTGSEQWYEKFAREKVVPYLESKAVAMFEEMPKELKAFIESGNNNRPVYYTFIYELLEGGKFQYQAYLLNYGEDEIYPFFENGFATQDELERKFYELIKSESYSSVDFHKCEPHEQLKISNQNKKVKEEQLNMAQEEEEKYLKVTPQGHKVLSIIKDGFKRNIAILHRESVGDYVVAARYDPKDGKWAQGTYDFQTVEAAEAYREEKYGKNASGAVIEEVKPARNWLMAHVAREALIAEHEYSSFLRMPNTGDYAGYGYSVYNNRMKNSRQLVDLQSDTRELCYDIRIAEDEKVKISHANGDEKEFTAREFIDLVSGTTSKDYEEKPRIEVNIPYEAKGNVYNNSIMFTLPNSVSSEKYTYFIPSRFVTYGEEENEGRIILSIPEDFIVKAQNFDGDEMEYDTQEFFDLCDGTDSEDYYFESDEEADEEEKKTWFYVTVNNAARVAQYDNSILFKMPKGDYEGYTYYIPNGFLKEDEEKGTIRIGLPEDFVVKPKDNKTGDEISMSAEEFADQVRNKRVAAYRYFQKPSEEAKEQFALKERMLRENIPPEMQERDNWVAIATFEKENGKLGKRPIDCNTGKFASDIDPETWTSFEKACKFARENGCTTIAYALDGKDNIACIDLDHCVEANGDYTELASKTFKLGNGTYCERSVSGQGLHVFGKTEGMDLRSFSQDGDMEFYRDSRFIAMTGDFYGSKALKSFDTPEMKALLESKFAKRAAVTNAGRGVEGLSQMNDREVYEKACSAYNGEKFKALYEGQDLKNDHSRSDMALMSSLAFWCNGDKEQMIRIFSTSGLYRREKKPSYYECTAIKAIETMRERYTPRPKTELKKPVSGNNSGGNGKR